MLGVQQAQTAYTTFRRRGARPAINSASRYLRREMNDKMAVGAIDDYCFQKSLPRLRELQSEEHHPREAVKTTREYRGVGPYRTINLQQHPADTRQVIDHIADKDIRSVLEIGTANGGSLYLWSRLPTTRQVVSIDLGFYPTQKQRLFRNYDPDTDVSAIIGDSHTAHVRKRAFDELKGGADLIFIDGDHRYEGVKQDFEDYRPLGEKFILFDDVKNQGPVERFWSETVEPSYDTVTMGEFDEQNTRRRGFGLVHL